MRAFRFLPALSLLALVACGGSAETAVGTGGSTSSTTSSSASGSSSASSSGSGGAGGAGTSSSSTSSSSGAGGAGTGGAGGGAGSCHWSPDANPCGVGMYCNATACADGVCAPVGTVEAQDRVPVCGCDGVTYWNTSIAASHAMPVQAASACAPAKTCGGFAALQCPKGASCNYHVPDKGVCNGADLAGTCWAVPATCMPGVGFGPLTRACGSLSCTDECDLIKLMTPWYDDSSCPQ